MIQRQTQFVRVWLTTAVAICVVSISPATAQWYCCAGPPPRTLSNWIAETEIAVVARRVAIHPDHPARYARFLQQKQQRKQAWQLWTELRRQANNNRSVIDEFLDGWKEVVGIEPEDPVGFIMINPLDTDSDDQAPEDEELATLGSTTYEVCWIAKGPADLRPGQLVQVGELDNSGANQYCLLLGDNKLPGIEWSMHVSGDDALLAYLQQAHPDEAPRLDRLRFYFDFLGSPCKTVASDARLGFSTIEPTESEWEALAKSLPLDQIRELSVVRQSNGYFYSRLISHVGDQDDARKLAEQFWIVDPDSTPDHTDLRSFLRLRRESGLDEFDARFRSNSRKFIEHKAVYLEVLQGLGEDPHGLLSRERLKVSVRLMLNDRRFASHAIRILADWQDWTVLDEVARLYGAEGFDRRHIREAIVYYLVHSTMDFTALQQRRFPGNAFGGGYYLNDLRTRDPRTYGYAARVIESAILEDDSYLTDSLTHYASSWVALMPLGRIASPRKHSDDGLTPLLQSPQARAIEKNLGYD